MFNILSYFYIAKYFFQSCLYKCNIIYLFNFITTYKLYTYLWLVLAILIFSRKILLLLLLPLPFLNFGNIFWSGSTNSFNIGLNNSLSVIHPLLLLCSLNFLYLMLLYLNTKYSFKKLTFSSLATAIYSMILGSYWSDQEVFWDGFWNWDYLEFIILFIVLTLFIISHFKNQNIGKVCKIAVLVYMIKLGTLTPFLSSVHSFSGTPLMFFSPINNSFFFFSILICGFLIFKRLFIFLKIFIFIYFITNYSLDMLTMKNIVKIRGFLFTSFIILILSNRVGHNIFLKFSKVLNIYFFKTTYLHFFIVYLLTQYWVFFNKTILVGVVVQELSDYYKLSCFGGKTSVFSKSLCDTFNIYFKSVSVGEWLSVTPSLDYKESFIR